MGAAFLSDRSRPFAAAVPGRPSLSEGLTTVLSWIGAAFLESPRAVCCVCLAGCGTPLSTYSSNPETNPHPVSKHTPFRVKTVCIDCTHECTHKSAGSESQI